MLGFTLSITYEAGTVSDPAHFEDITFYRHWHQESEAFAGGDSLMTALVSGWSMLAINMEKRWCGGSRCVTVYYFDLERDQQRVTMPVVSNPYVECLIAKSELSPVEVDVRAASGWRGNDQRA